MNTGSIIRLSRFTLAPALTALLLAGCNTEGGSSGGSEANLADLGDTELTLSFSQTKLFKFDWQPVSGVTHYRLDEKVNKTSGYVTVADNIDKNITHYELTVPLYDRTDAQYTLNGCINQKCTPLGGTAVAVVDPAQLVNSIGYIKGFHPGGQTLAGPKFFGTAVALSENGTTLAVGTPSGAVASSSGTTLNNAGIVYVYRKNNEGIWKNDQRLLAPFPDADDKFGLAISINGDGTILAIGAPNDDSDTRFGKNAGEINSVNQASIFNNSPNATDSGAVYVYAYNKEDNKEDWKLDAYIKEDSVRKEITFGQAVSISTDGKTLAIARNFGGGLDSTVVFTYQYNEVDKTWIKLNELADETLKVERKLVLAGSFDKSAELEDSFGSFISLNKEGTVLVVGAPDQDSSATTVTDSLGNESYISIHQVVGNTAFIQLDSPQVNNAVSNSGVIYIYERENTNLDWTPKAYVKASNPGSSDRFGSVFSLSADGNDLAVGVAPEDTDARGVFIGDAQPKPLTTETGTNNIGAVYLFSRIDKNNAWSQTAFIKAPNAELSDNFGSSVSLSNDGNRLAVGASRESSNALGLNGSDNNGKGSSGATYVYRRDNNRQWSDTPTYIKASNTDTGDLYGSAVTLSGDGKTLAVGATHEDSNATGVNGDQSINASSTQEGFTSGAVYLY